MKVSKALINKLEDLCGNEPTNSLGAYIGQELKIIEEMIERITELEALKGVIEVTDTDIDKLLALTATDNLEYAIVVVGDLFQDLEKLESERIGA